MQHFLDHIHFREQRKQVLTAHSPREKIPLRARWRLCWPLAVGLLAAGQTSSHLAAEQRPTDTQVKAIYLHDFAKYATWPAEKSASDGPFTICLDHAESFFPTLQSAVAGEKIGGRSVEVKWLGDQQEAVDCDILYIDSSDQGRVDALLAAVGRHPVLTVSDASGFIDHGGMIEFVMEGSRVRFRVGLGAAQKAGIALSSQLLKVAQRVSSSPSVEGLP